MPLATWPRVRLEKPMRTYEKRVRPSPLRKLLTRNVSCFPSLTNTLARLDGSGRLDGSSSMSHQPFTRRAVFAWQERDGGTAALLSHDLCRRPCHCRLNRENPTAVLRESA